MTLANEQYPLSTQDGDSIPLDVIRPVGMVFQTFVAGSWTAVTLPAGTDLVTIKADEDCYLDLLGTKTTALAAGTYYASVLYIPKGFVVTAQLAAGAIKVWGIATTGNIYIQLVGRWATLSLPRQTSNIVSRG